jgi:TetR/AcrR family transcriptional regulator, regulator of cefoperazone and chloramphenicol sensitivity
MTRADDTPENTPENTPEKTRERLLEAATQVFAEAGYKGASTREICRLAGANAAAIHYHFGDKAALYREVFAQPFVEVMAASAGMDDTKLTVEQALERYYRSFFAPLTGGPKLERLLRLHAREQGEPSGVLGDLECQTVRPHHEALIAILCRALGLRAPDLEVHRLAFCLAGMALVWIEAKDIVEAFSPGLMQGRDPIGVMAQRLTGYAAAIVEGERVRRAAVPKKRRS